MENLLPIFIDLIHKEPCYLTDEGVLSPDAVHDAIHNHEKNLLSLLLSHPVTKEHFFLEAGEYLIFDKSKFSLFFHDYVLPQCCNNYNLLVTEHFSHSDSSKQKIGLTFPFKDCILKNSALKESAIQKEIYLHKILHQESIRELLKPKALTGARRYTERADMPCTQFDHQKDNLIIHGDNLVAMASIREQYKGLIQCIYFDPPYNTGSNGFQYNDRFDRSTWLIFMKNRLELAKELLSEEGAIYVQLDYNQVHYAKVLMDEIFGEENFQREIIWRIGWVSGYKTAAGNYVRNHDTILFYAKNAGKLKFYKNDIKNEDFHKKIKNEKDFIQKLDHYGVHKSKAKEILDYINHESRIEKYPLEDVWNGNEYDDLNSVAIVSYSGETVSKMLGCRDIKGQKSEKLIKRILEAHTKEGDLVLDIFGGTGTTAAVAHKMNRRYILCEQMDYINDIILERMKKVLDGEQSGISKSCNWHGGGSFVFCRLATLNKTFIRQIKQARHIKELHRVWEKFLSKNPEYSSIDVKEYQPLPLADKKRLLIQFLEHCLTYVNFCDMEDSCYCISAEDQQFTESFYRP